MLKGSCTSWPPQTMSGGKSGSGKRNVVKVFYMKTGGLHPPTPRRRWQVGRGDRVV